MAISFRPLAVNDLENVVRWVRDDDVQRWWYPEGTSESEIRAEYEPSAQSESHGLDKTARYIVDVDGHDIGLAQCTLATIRNTPRRCRVLVLPGSMY